MPVKVLCEVIEYLGVYTATCSNAHIIHRILYHTEYTTISLLHQEYIIILLLFTVDYMYPYSWKKH